MLIESPHTEIPSHPSIPLIASKKNKKGIKEETKKNSKISGATYISDVVLSTVGCSLLHTIQSNSARICREKKQDNVGIIPILWAGDILVKSKNALKTLKPRINLKKGEGALGNYSERVPNSNIFALFSPSCGSSDLDHPDHYCHDRLS